MDLFTLDFETPYDSKSEFTLKKMSTEDYVCDPRLSIFMCAVKRNAEPTYLLDGPQDEIIAHLRSLNLHKHAVSAHNMMFDGLLLQYRCNIIPKLYIDTLSMARPICGSHLKSLSLSSLVKFFGLGEKGDEVVRADGKLRRQDFTDYEWAEYGRYCVNDTDLDYRLYQRMRNHMRPTAPEGVAPNGEWWMDSANKPKLLQFPDEELRSIDATMRMYTQPQLVLNLKVLEDNQVITRKRKGKILAEMELRGITDAVLRSTDKFAALLESMDIEVPLKASPTDLKNKVDPPRMIPAFGKNDEGFKALQEEYEDDLEVSTLLNARVSEKSTMEEQRTDRLIHIAKRYPKFRVPIAYSSAHTTRDGGTEKINAQNPPKVDKSRMRYAIEAPDGHLIVDLDQNAIEARLTGVSAGSSKMVEQFARNEDIYSAMASDLYGRPVDRKKKALREDGSTYFPDYTPGQCGKGCILGLGFGMRSEKFRITLAGQYGVKTDFETADKYANIYHDKYPEIREHHTEIEQALYRAIRDKTRTQVGPVEIGPDGITFPTGMLIAYPNLIHKSIKDKYGKMRSRLFYRRAKDKFDSSMFGGKCLENFIQKLARDIVFWQANLITRETGRRHVLRVHDALAFVLPEGKAEEFKKVALEIMSRRPVWLPDAPLLAEAKIGKSYGDT